MQGDRGEAPGQGGAAPSLSGAHWLAGEREAAIRVLARSATRFGSVGLSILIANVDALALLKTLAEKDHEAQVALAHLYKEGRGLPADPDLASTLFRRAAEQGNPEGQFQVGRALWWAAQSDPGNAMANARRSEAEPWLRKAAGQCHLEAQQIIDDYYDKVSFEKKSRNQTLIKARRADAIAQGELALDYFTGRVFGGPLSDKDAYAWSTIALEWGGPAPEVLERLQRELTWRMSHDEMAEAKAHTAVLRRSLCVD